MKNIIKWIFLSASSIIIIYYVIGYFSSYIGWNGYKKWEYRKASQSVSESINRKIFVKKLNYLIEDYSGFPFPFEVYIEHGYRWGINYSEQTITLKESKFPY